jgi:hypothetical protein
MDAERYAGPLDRLLRDARYQAVHIVPLGDEVVLEGVVGDYESKRKIEAMLTGAGLRARNCLRVMPGLASATTPANTSKPAVLLSDAGARRLRVDGLS